MSWTHTATPHLLRWGYRLLLTDPTVIARTLCMGVRDASARRPARSSAQTQLCRLSHLRAVPPTALEGIERYLGSGMIKGIGAHFAHKLGQAFGAAVFDILEQMPNCLQDLDGGGPKRTARVVAAWAEQQVVRDIMVFLHSYGDGVAVCSTCGIGSCSACLRRSSRPYLRVGGRSITVFIEPVHLTIGQHVAGMGCVSTHSARAMIAYGSN